MIPDRERCQYLDSRGYSRARIKSVLRAGVGAFDAMVEQRRFIRALISGLELEALALLKMETTLVVAGNEYDAELRQRLRRSYAAMAESCVAVVAALELGPSCVLQVS